MSSAAICAGPWTDARIERLQPWIAALSSALLHLLMLLILLYASTPIVTTPQGAASGSRVRVDFIGQPRQSEQIVQTPQDPPPSQASEPVQPPAGSRVQSTLVEHADDPVPPPASTPSDTRTAQRSPNPVQRPREPQPRPQPPTPDSMEQSQAQVPATHPPPSARRRPETWTGRPPGLIAEDAAPENAGLANSPAISNGRGRDMTDAGPSMELGGYLVYYDVLSEARLRAWAEQGMKELYIPLPGTRYYMICPLEIALKRESGKCRALEPESPQMQAIGDARKAVTMLQVYKQGELVWRGPGPYR
ncbi:plasmid stabilization protein ParE [Pseudoxanthomonas wuyuanensis]|uniref:Plasmid stabilization protein ParE n=1 Tax=Pseudoxanthomonas wuyuanensis TaxID=1073196 RepID=A0A286DBY2_9GAMM|nr:plasmid stabilization protein ParE [Pseudoxanthomonas wuyuanensis]KAF1721682.1 plasmid stabilization protein ParE [Pseudoxanthomonas wuyuanensis]SOD56128.1 hypothetical protein SAMN06296416_108189 [Pseudoxanthomonas wuyuanensis]